jgi:hypothetical protein
MPVGLLVPVVLDPAAACVLVSWRGPGRLAHAHRLEEPVAYVELPGAHHDFGLSESIRASAVDIAVTRFVAGPCREASGDPEPAAPP